MDSPEVRIGDDEREQALRALGEHMSAGRLTVDEYGDRSSKAAAAKTQSELNELFADLPEPHPKPAPAWATTPQPEPSRQPLAWVDRPVTQRLVAASFPVLLVIAIVIGITTHIWWFMAVPFITVMVGKRLWGEEWSHGYRDEPGRHGHPPRHLRHDGHGRELPDRDRP